MTCTKLALGLSLLFGAAAVPTSFADDMATTKPTTQPMGKYVCPMCHTSSDKPGKCPQCGMEMKKSSEMKHKHGATTKPSDAKSETDMDMAD